MLTRVLTAVVLAPLLVALLMYGADVWLAAVLGLALWRCSWELLAMHDSLRTADRWLAAAVTALVALAPLAGQAAWATAAACASVVVLAAALWRADDVQVASQRALSMILSVAYVGMMGASVTAIACTSGPSGLGGSVPFGRCALMTLFAVVFAGDTGAYFAGRFFGRRKLYPLVSPKKTVEGTVGGLLCSLAAGFGCAAGGLISVDPAVLCGVALLCGAVAQVGDLAESLFKRASGTKDSGSLLPGHGGMLDRLDGVLFAAPVMWAWLVWLLP